jgi:hypothetical protein
MLNAALPFSSRAFDPVSSTSPYVARKAASSPDRAVTSATPRNTNSWATQLHWLDAMAL